MFDKRLKLNISQNKQLTVPPTPVPCMVSLRRSRAPQPLQLLRLKTLRDNSQHFFSTQHILFYTKSCSLFHQNIFRIQPLVFLSVANKHLDLSHHLFFSDQYTVFLNALPLSIHTQSYFQHSLFSIKQPEKFFKDLSQIMFLFCVKPFGGSSLFFRIKPKSFKMA